MNHSFFIISTHSFVQIPIPSTVTIQSAVFSLNPDTEHQKPKGSRFIFCAIDYFLKYEPARIESGLAYIFLILINMAANTLPIYAGNLILHSKF